MDCVHRKTRPAQDGEGDDSLWCEECGEILTRRVSDKHYCVFTADQIGAILYACEDMGSEYLSEEDPGIAWMGEILVNIIPLLKAALP